MPYSCPEKCTINHIILHPENKAVQDLTSPQFQPTNIIPSQADTDQELIQLWLHGKSIHTQPFLFLNLYGLN